MKLLANLAAAAMLLFAGIAFASPATAADPGQTYDFCADFHPEHPSAADIAQYNSYCGVPVSTVTKRYHCPDVKPHTWIGMTAADKLRIKEALVLWDEHGCKEPPPPRDPPGNPPDDEEVCTDDSGDECPCVEDDSYDDEGYDDEEYDSDDEEYEEDDDYDDEEYDDSDDSGEDW